MPWKIYKNEFIPIDRSKLLTFFDIKTKDRIFFRTKEADN